MFPKRCPSGRTEDVEDDLKAARCDTLLRGDRRELGAQASVGSARPYAPRTTINRDRERGQLPRAWLQGSPVNEQPNVGRVQLRQPDARLPKWRTAGRRNDRGIPQEIGVVLG